MAGNDKAGGDGAQLRLAEEKSVSVLAPPGLVSILIPCVGQLEYTKLCVPSVLRHTRAPFELIFLDIGSLDGTAAYLDGIAAASQIRVEVVRTATDLGIAEAVGDALGRARGETLVLLNNDCIVPEHWLEQMTSLAASSPTIGAVGPMSNYAADPQEVETVPYRIGPRKGTPRPGTAAGAHGLVDVQAVHAFACAFRDEHKGKYVLTERLGGFCLLVKRAVLKRIEQTGSLKEWTDLQLFNTDILSVKARQAGFSLGCCRDLFVHHFGSRTFAHGAPTKDDDKKN